MPAEDQRKESRQPGGQHAREPEWQGDVGGGGENSTLPPALCLKKGRRQGHCVCSMALLWFCSFPTLTAGGQGACFIVWVFSSLCVVNSTPLQGDRQGIVCFLKKILLFPVWFSAARKQLSQRKIFKEMLHNSETGQSIYLWHHRLNDPDFFPVHLAHHQGEPPKTWVLENLR